MGKLEINSSPKTLLIKDSASENLRNFDAFSWVAKDNN